MLYTKFQDILFLGFKEDDFQRVSTIYEHGSHLDHWVGTTFVLLSQVGKIAHQFQLRQTKILTDYYIHWNCHMYNGR